MLMKKSLLLMAVALCFGLNVWAQEEGGEEQPPVVHTKTLRALIADARNIVDCSAYTAEKQDLQSAIETAEESLPNLADDLSVRAVLEELQGAIDAYVFANPHVDATDRLQNPSFDKDANNSTTITSWTNAGFKQNRRSVGYPSTRKDEVGNSFSVTNFVEQWANATALSGSGDIYQQVTNLPSGHYRLTADFFLVSQKDPDVEEVTGAEFYANEQVVELGMTDVGDGTNAAAYSIDIDVAQDETLTIGFRFSGLNINWLGWDNVTLTWIGDPEPYNAIVNVEKIAAAREVLTNSINASRDALAGDAPLFRAELEAAITEAEGKLESTDLDELAEADKALNDILSYFKGYNKYYTDLKAAIAAAEELLASGQLTEGADEFQQEIDYAKHDLEDAVTTYGSEPELAVVELSDAKIALQNAEATFRIRNASYANPANVITNGSMASTDGWDILVPGANPGLHINTSGNVTGFSKPFMECWVNNTDYGQENYARQTVNTLPDGKPLLRGYYVLKAAALATRQDQAGLEVSGVTLRLQDEEIAVHTANGVSQVYMIGYDMPEDGGELSFGLFIDASTNANWIAWDEVELQFVGPKDKYLADFAEAVLGESLGQLKQAVADAKALIESVDANGVDIESESITGAIDNAEYIIEHPMETSSEEIAEAISALEQATADFYRSGVSPKNGESFDFTNLLLNPNFDTDAQGWTVVSGELPAGEDCVYWWFGGSTTMDLTEDFQQTLNNMPAGNYLLDVQASIRVDMNYSTSNYTAERIGNYLTSCKVYANNDSTDVHPFFYEDEEKGLTLESMLAMTNDYDYRHGNGTLIDYMLKESGLFHSYVLFTLEDKDDITVGFHMELPQRAGQMPFIDYFHLSYFGNQDITGVSAPTVETAGAKTGIYDLMGRRVSKPQRGLYIMNGRKVLVK